MNSEKIKKYTQTRIDALDELNKLKQKYTTTFLLTNQQSQPIVIEQQEVLPAPVAGPSVQPKTIKVIQDFDTNEEVNTMLASLDTHQLIIAAKIKAEVSVRNRDIALQEVIQQLKTPDIDVEQVARDAQVDLLEQYGLAEYSRGLGYYASVREDAKNLYTQQVRDVDRAKNDKKGGISTVTPSAWFKHYVEDMLSPSTAADVLYVSQKVKVILPDNKTEVRTVKTYAQDLHHLLSRFGASMSMIPFIPDEMVRETMNPTVFTDTQLLFEFVAATNPSLINWELYMADEYSYLHDPTQYSTFIAALALTINELLEIKDTINFQGSGRTIMPYNNSNKKQAGVSQKFISKLLPFMIDNKARYDNAEFEKARAGKRIDHKTQVRDTAIGRTLNFNRAAAAEMVKQVKRIMSQQYIQKDTDVFVKSQLNISTLDCVREVYAAILTAATTINFVKGKDTLDKIFNRLLAFNHTTKRVQFVPALEAYPGALFYAVMFEPTYPFENKNLTEDADYYTKPRKDLVTLFENFVRVVPALAETKAEKYMPTLTGTYTAANRNPIAFSTSTTKDILQGLRYMEGDVLRRFKINNMQLMGAVTAGYLNKALQMQVTDSASLTKERAYFYSMSREDEKYGNVLGLNNVLNLPANYVQVYGFQFFAEIPIVYRFKSYGVSLEKEKKQTYASGEDLNRPSMYSILESIAQNQGIRVEETMQTA